MDNERELVLLLVAEDGREGELNPRLSPGVSQLH